MAAAPTRVLVIDDSAVVRKLLGDALRLEPGVEVVGGAADPYAARDMIMRLKPDFLTLDIEMPRMDGLTFLGKLMASHPLPTIVVSSLTQAGSQASLEALRLGAIDVIAKPGGPTAVAQLGDELRQRLRTFRAGPPPRLVRPSVTPAATPTRAFPKLSRGLFLIGASTGGTQAIETILSRLPADLPPIVIVQHMPPVYTRLFAERMNSTCALTVIEAQGDEVLQRGMVYIAPGGYHLTLEASGVQIRTRLNQEPQMHFQRPAVDALFQSACRLRGVPIVAALLTGMGADGADGMVSLRKAGATTIAEAEESCVVFGMPREAIARGGAVEVASLLDIPTRMTEAMAALLQPAVGSHHG